MSVCDEMIENVPDVVREMFEYVGNLDNCKRVSMTGYVMTAQIFESCPEKSVMNDYVRWKSGRRCMRTSLTESTPILLKGKHGAKERIAVSRGTLCKYFTLPNGSPIELESLTNHCNFIDGEYEFDVKCNTALRFDAMCLPTAYPYCGGKIKIGDKMLWVNLDGRISERALGDFLVCPLVDGDLDLPNVFVMQGDLFLDVFDRSMWQECILDLGKKKVEQGDRTNLSLLERRMIEQKIVVPDNAFYGVWLEYVDRQDLHKVTIPLPEQKKASGNSKTPENELGQECSKAVPKVEVSENELTVEFDANLSDFKTYEEELFRACAENSPNTELKQIGNISSTEAIGGVEKPSKNGVFYNLQDAVITLFAFIISGKNLKKVLRQIDGLSEKSNSRLLTSLENLVKEAGSVEAFKHTLSIWKLCRKTLSENLFEILTPTVVRGRLARNGMFGKLELPEDAFGNTVLGFVFYLSDRLERLDSKYIFKCVDVFTTVPLRGYAGSYTDIVPLTSEASLLLEQVDYPGCWQDYSFCPTYVMSMFCKKQEYTVVTEISKDECFLKAKNAWRTLLSTIPVEPPEFFKPRRIEGAKLPVETKRKRRKKFNLSPRILKVIDELYKQSVEYAKLNKPKVPKETKLTPHPEFIDLIRDTVSSPGYKQAQIKKLLSTQSELLATMTVLLTNKSAHWKIGVKAATKKATADNVFDANYVVKVENTWYFILYSYALADKHWRSKVALMTYDEVTKSFIGRRYVFDLDDQPWHYSWMELGNMAYAETPVSLPMSPHKIREFLL